jgi:peptidoglycan/LPS O-acetylase OafA/YrhL
VSLAGALYLAAPFLGFGNTAMTLVTVGFFWGCVNYSGRPYRWLSYLGSASYSIYLMHSVALAVLKNIITERNAAMFVAFVAVSLLVGVAYHQYVEEASVRVVRKLLKTPAEK